MRICLVFYDMQDFGGLEEYAATLAIGLKQLGHETSVLSAAWVPRDNQYKRRLHDHGVPFVEVPERLSKPASDWDTKIRILTTLVWIATPLIYLAALPIWWVRRCSFTEAIKSARGWLSRQLLERGIAPDRRKPLARLLLRWWQLWWRPDVLHIQGYTSNLLFVVDWAYSRGLPVVYEEHQTPDPQFSWWKDFRQTINKAATVVAVSERSADALRSVCGVTRPIVVRPPLLPDLLPAHASPPETSLRRPGQMTLNVTTVARLYVTKGLAYLLEAIVQVRTVYPTTNFRVYGDGPLRVELEAQARHLGLDPDAIFPGAFTSREALARIMADTDVFVMSSVLEGQPLGVVEAMAYGCPIVSTSVGGIPELIQHGVNGLLCPPADPERLAACVSALIADPDLRGRLGREARRSYEAGGFQPSAVCRHLASTYEEAVTRTRTSSDHEATPRPLDRD